MSDEHVIVDGKKIPVLPAKATVTVKHKRTGAIYESKNHFALFSKFLSDTLALH